MSIFIVILWYRALLFPFAKFAIEIEFACEFWRFMENYEIEIKLKSHIQSG